MSLCTNFLNSSRWSWKESAMPLYMNGRWNESMCTNSLPSPKWSERSQFVVLHYLFTLISGCPICVVQWCRSCCTCSFFASALAAWGCSPGFHGEVFSLHSMVISPLTMGISSELLGSHWGCMVDSSSLHSMVGSLLWSWNLGLLVMSAGDHLGLIYFLKWNCLLVPLISCLALTQLH